MRRRLIVMSILAGLACSSRPTGTDDESLRREIEPWIEDGRPVLVSPDGSQLLHKVETADLQSELRLFDRETKAPRGVLKGGWPLLITWRPDQQTIAFVTDDGGDQRYELRLWTPADGSVRVLDAPVCRTADRMPQWSPDRRHLAVWIDPDDASAGKHLRVIDTTGGGTPTVVPLEGIADFRWAPDGGRLAYVTGDHPGKLGVLPRGAPGPEYRDLPGVSRPRRFAWHADGRRLVFADRGEGGRSSLVQVDIEAVRGRALVDTGGTLDHPVTLVDGTVLYHVDEAGQRRLHAWEPDGSRRVLGPAEGHSAWMATEPGGRVVYVDHTGLAGPRHLYRVALAGGAPERVAGQLGYAEVEGVRPAFLTLTTAGGEDFPVYLRRPPGFTGPTRGVLIKVPIAAIKAGRAQYEGINEYLVRQGFDVLTISRTGDPDGSATDDGERERAVARVLAAIDYARERLGASTARTVLYGSSYGSSICVIAAGRAPDRVGAMVLQGITPLARLANPAGARVRVAAFHGEKDPFGPEAATRLLESRLGEDLFASRRGTMTVLPGEGHGVRLRASQTHIGAAMLRFLRAGQ